MSKTHPREHLTVLDQNHLRNECHNSAPPYHDFEFSALALFYHGLDKQSLAGLNNVGSKQSRDGVEPRG